MNDSEFSPVTLPTKKETDITEYMHVTEVPTIDGVHFHLTVAPAQYDNWRSQSRIAAVGSFTGAKVGDAMFDAAVRDIQCSDESREFLTQFKQLHLDDILMNSLDACSSSNRQAEIDFYSHHDEDSIVFEVEDNGVGYGRMPEVTGTRTRIFGGGDTSRHLLQTDLESVHGGYSIAPIMREDEIAGTSVRVEVPLR